jgi:iron transport multicopper oxidase
LIVHDDQAYFADEVEQEFVITLSDWYHDLVEDIAPDFMSLYNPTGAEPIPNAFLFNDTLGSSVPVRPNKTYLFRIINISAFVGQYFYIEGHNFRIVEIDGVYVDPAEADTIYLGVAQRYAILVTTKNTTDQNFPIVTIADHVLLDTIPPDLQLNNTNWLEYNSSAPHNQANVTLDIDDALPAFDDMTLVPHDRQPLLGEPSKRIELTVIMAELGNGLPYALLNNITFTPPKVPVIYTALTTGDLATNSIVYGEYTNPFVLEHNEVVEVVLNNNDGGTHPFHLHGHNFQLLSRTPSYGKDFYSFADLPSPVPYDPNNHTAFPEFPARRDTFVLPPQGSFVIRFVADNPGVWIFHCHIDWHLSQGLASVFIEAPTQLQQRTTVPKDHLAVCAAANVPAEGNAAANSLDFLDLQGQNKQPGVIPYGSFTTKGIVAMTFSVLSGILGIIALAIYGMSDMKYVVKGGVDSHLAMNPRPSE